MVDTPVADPAVVRTTPGAVASDIEPGAESTRSREQTDQVSGTMLAT